MRSASEEEFVEKMGEVLREGGAREPSVSGGAGEAPRMKKEGNRRWPEPWLQIRPEGQGHWWNLREAWEFRDLWFSLAARDLRLRYRQTALGVLWVLFQPLAGAGVFTFVFGMVLGPNSSGGTAVSRGAADAGQSHYFLFSLAGTLLWTLFASTFSKASLALIGNAALVAKVYFPRILLPFSTVLSSLVDFGIGMVAYGVLSFWQGHFPSFDGWLFLMGWALTTIAGAMGLGLVASAVMSRFRDVQHALPLLLPFLMYASPVGYSLERVPSEWRRFFELNPLTWILEGSRSALLGASTVPMSWAAGSVLASALIFVSGIWVYRRMEKGVSDVL